MKIFTAGLYAVLLATLMSSRALDATSSCESLASMTLPNMTITLARDVQAGAFAPPAFAGATAPQAAGQEFCELPAFCRVAATLKPSDDSDIKIEVWMPASGWNGKVQAVGNGGWAGVISYSAMAAALRRGYAAASTDTGHSGTNFDGSFAFNHPEKLVDFAYRAVHERC
jgi:feruloyl esterase